MKTEEIEIYRVVMTLRKEYTYARTTHGAIVTLLTYNESMERVPLAERMRPQKLDEVIGQNHLLNEGEILRQIIKQKEPVSLILWGPPGSGKTTLARIIAREVNADLSNYLPSPQAKRTSKKSSYMPDKIGTYRSERFFSSTKFTASIKHSKTLSCHTWNQV